MDKIERIKELTQKLNIYRDAYYNKSTSLISDYEYDCLYDELERLEKEVSFSLYDSPTQQVGYTVVSELKKIKHNHPMLSMNKTKSENHLINFLHGRQGVLMAKMDGLTVSARYKNGKLIGLETRGNGEIGEDIFHNAASIIGLPGTINCAGEVTVDGEAIICYNTMKMINDSLPEEEQYKHPRNLASGSVRQMDSAVCAARKVRFIAWQLVYGVNKTNSFADNLEILEKLGFTAVPYIRVKNDIELKRILENEKDSLRVECSHLEYPIDGYILRYDNIQFADSLGRTGHHWRGAIAFKFYDEEELSHLQDVKWSIGKTGVLTPVAIFDPVELDGTKINRASLHNVTIFKGLKLGCGDEISIYKANQIIPQIRDNFSKSGTCQIPEICPLCGSSLIIEKNYDTEVLKCPNELCSGKLLKKFSNFVSREAMNIEGFSESTLEKCIDSGWLNQLSDIYKLPEHFKNLASMEGYGEKSAKNLCEAIEKNKNCSMQQLLVACSIPLIGRSQAKRISKFYNNSWNDFLNDLRGNPKRLTEIDGIGSAAVKHLDRWIHNEYYSDGINIVERIISIDSSETFTNKLDGKTFCITGNLKHFKNRKGLVECIEKYGGRVAEEISSKTDFLISNDITSSAKKVTEAKKKGVSIISETEFLNYL